MGFRPIGYSPGVYSGVMEKLKPVFWDWGCRNSGESNGKMLWNMKWKPLYMCIYIYT